MRVKRKEIKTVAVPKMPENVFPTFLPRKILNRKPKNGASNNIIAKLVSIKIILLNFSNYQYQLNLSFYKQKLKLLVQQLLLTQQPPLRKIQILHLRRLDDR